MVDVPVVFVVQAPQLLSWWRQPRSHICRSSSIPHFMAVAVRMRFFARFTGFFRTPSTWTSSAGWRGRRELAPRCSATQLGASSARAWTDTARSSSSEPHTPPKAQTGCSVCVVIFAVPLCCRHGWRWQRDGSCDEAAATTTACMGLP